MTMVECIPSYCSRRTLILGCGNTLLGDDGFGPEVIAYLTANYSIPEYVTLMDAGTGVNEVLLDLALCDKKPKRIVIVDAIDNAQPSGTVSVTPLEHVRCRPARVFSPHLAPTSSLLKELSELGRVEVTLLTVKPDRIPQDIQPGLSPAVRQAVPRACEIIARFLRNNEDLSLPQGRAYSAQASVAEGGRP